MISADEEDARLKALENEYNQKEKDMENEMRRYREQMEAEQKRLAEQERLKVEEERQKIELERKKIEQVFIISTTTKSIIHIRKNHFNGKIITKIEIN